VAHWRAKDPITTFPQRLIDEFGFSQTEIDAVKAEVEAEIEEIKRFALESPWPDVNEIAEHMFA
jgi:TPP-dependent pyruvate/acetoin dehydrogenase alpha subunit